MKSKIKIDYWLVSSENDWKVAGHLFEKGDYAYALFLGHLTLEKLLKALFVAESGKTPPRTHNLVYLAEKSDMVLSDQQIELLEAVNDFNLEARYPDEKFSFYRRCTKAFTIHYLEQIKDFKQWLLQNTVLSAM